MPLPLLRSAIRSLRRWPFQIGFDLVAIVLLSALVVPVAYSQLVERVTLNGEPEHDALVQRLFAAIAALSDYRAERAPPVYRVPQHVLEAMVCESPCNLRAAYIPRDGVYLAGNLDPLREPLDRAALLHELVHFLQQGHPKFAALNGCARERAKEEEAYAIQNAFLSLLGQAERVAFFAGDFECEALEAAQ